MIVDNNNDPQAQNDRLATDDQANNKDTSDWIKAEKARLETDFPLSGGETEEDFFTTGGEDENVVEREHINTNFPLSGGETDEL